MRRRSILAATGSMLALAGCLGSTAPDGSTAVPSDTPEPDETPPESDVTTPAGTDTPESNTTTETPSVPLEVSVDALQRGSIWMNSPDSTTVRGSNEQHLFLDVSRPDSVAASDAPELQEFSLRFDGRDHQPTKVDGSFGLYRARNDAPYSGGSGFLLFELPETGDAAAAALVWPGGEWTVPEPTRRRLAAPVPPLSVDVTIPETIQNHEPVPLSFEVTNDGEVATTFVAAVDRAGPYVAHYPAEQLRLTVPPGETVTETVENRFMEYPRGDVVGDGEPDATYYVSWAGGSTEAAVRVVEE